MVYTFELVYIPKIRVLPISHIRKRSRLQIPRLQTTLLLALQSISALVLPTQQYPEENDDTRFDQMRDDHAPDAELVVRFLRLQVEEWADDVTGAVSEEEDSVCEDFLGMPCECKTGHISNIAQAPRFVTELFG